MVGSRTAAPFSLPEPEPSRPASSLAQSSTPGDGALKRSDGEDIEHSRTEVAPTSGIAVSPGAAAFNVPGTGDLADEIAHLQALIDGLTETVERRIPKSLDV